MNELQKMFTERVSDEIADELLISQITSDMWAKLEKKRDEGRGGWHTGSCDNSKLKAMLIKHIDKGDMIDVANLAAMMHVRQKLYGQSA